MYGNVQSKLEITYRLTGKAEVIKSNRLAQAVYPIAEDFEIPVWLLPGLGYVAQNFIEGI